MRIIVIVAASIALTASAAAAQTFNAPKLRPGAKVEVRALNARPALGTVTSVTPELLTISSNGFERTFTPDGVARVDVFGRDSLWNGIRQGYRISSPYWWIGSALAGPCEHKAYEVLCLAGFQLGAGAAFGATGAVADALHDGRTVVFQSASEAAAADRMRNRKLGGALIGAGIGGALGSHLCGQDPHCNVHDRISTGFWLAELFAVLGSFIAGHAGGTAGSHVSPTGPPTQIQFRYSFPVSF